MTRILVSLLILATVATGCTASYGGSVWAQNSAQNPCLDSTLTALQKRPIQSLTDREFAYLVQRQHDCDFFNTTVLAANGNISAINAQSSTQASLVTTGIVISLLTVVITAAALQQSSK